MSYMKCPFCNQELDRDLKGECGCINEQCQKSVFMFGSEELWQELIRTRKALEIAVDALNKIINAQGQCWGATDTEIKFECKHYASEALEQITAEQKEEK